MLLALTFTRPQRGKEHLTVWEAGIASMAIGSDQDFPRTGDVAVAVQAEPSRAGERRSSSTDTPEMG
jgi:hypothetical protein